MLWTHTHTGRERERERERGPKEGGICERKSLTNVSIHVNIVHTLFHLPRPMYHEPIDIDTEQWPSKSVTFQCNQRIEPLSLSLSSRSIWMATKNFRLKRQLFHINYHLNMLSHSRRCQIQYKPDLMTFRWFHQCKSQLTQLYSVIHSSYNSILAFAIGSSVQCTNKDTGYTIGRKWIQFDHGHRRCSPHSNTVLPTLVNITDTPWPIAVDSMARPSAVNCLSHSLQPSMSDCHMVKDGGKWSKCAKNEEREREMKTSTVRDTVGKAEEPS